MYFFFRTDSLLIDDLKIENICVSQFSMDNCLHDLQKKQPEEGPKNEDAKVILSKETIDESKAVETKKEELKQVEGQKTF